MTNNFPALKRLGGGIVGVCRIGEGAGLEIGNLNLDSEGGIGSNILARLRRNNDGGNHICSGWNITHDW